MSESPNVPVVPQEVYDRAIKLETIFMPQSRQQRVEAGFGDDATRKPIRFVHYTSAEAALSIIRTRRIWMRNTTCMADFSEFNHGYEMIGRYFANEEKGAAFTAALDRCHPGAAVEASALFAKCWQELRFNTYITSVSEHYESEDSHGRLSMWRAFGSGERVVSYFASHHFPPRRLL